MLIVCSPNTLGGKPLTFSFANYWQTSETCGARHSGSLSRAHGKPFCQVIFAEPGICILQTSGHVVAPSCF